MERCRSVQILNPAEYKGGWRRAFPQFCHLYLEIGCGKGRFTCETAAQNPDILFVAVERVPEAMEVAMERVVAAQLNNVRFIDCDAAILGDLFAPGEVERLYINFCDPWPGKRHAKRRLTSGGFLAIYKQLLPPGGEIHFKTDNLPLYEYSLEQLEENGFVLSEITRDLHQNGPCGVMTDYENKFYQQGIKINRCVATVSAES